MATWARPQVGRYRKRVVVLPPPAAPQFSLFIWTGFGGAVAAGAAATRLPIRRYVGAGGGLASGNATTTSNPHLYTWIGISGAVAAGAAATSRLSVGVNTYTGSGGAAAGGTAPHGRAKVGSVSGTAIVSGAAATSYVSAAPLVFHVDPRTGSLPAAFTTTRAGTATHVNIGGNIEVVGANLPRFDYDPITLAPLGLLGEESRTNLILDSSNFSSPAQAFDIGVWEFAGGAQSNWTLTGATGAANATVAPDGSLTADQILETTANSAHSATQSVAKAASSLAYVDSIFVKASGRTTGAVRLDDGAGNGWTFGFDLSAGVGYTTGTGLGQLGTGFSSPGIFMQQFQNGFWRISCRIVTNTATTIRRIIYSTSSLGTLTFAGDAAMGLYLWGDVTEQVPNISPAAIHDIGAWEMASTAAPVPVSSYIPTTSAAVTRAADVTTMPVAQIPNFNAPASTWVAQIMCGPLLGTTEVYVSVDDGTVNERVRLVKDSSDALRVIVTDGGTEVANLNMGQLIAGATTLVAFRVVANNFAACRDGGAVVSDATGTIPTVTTLRLLCSPAGEQANGWLQLLDYYNQGRSDADLGTLTGAVTNHVLTEGGDVLNTEAGGQLSMG